MASRQFVKEVPGNENGCNSTNGSLIDETGGRNRLKTKSHDLPHLFAVTSGDKNTVRMIVVFAAGLSDAPVRADEEFPTRHVHVQTRLRLIHKWDISL
jgi:hypothetical protein